MLNPAIHDILLGFEPITLSEMDRVKLMNRVDTKFAFSIKCAAEILNSTDNRHSLCANVPLLMRVPNIACPVSNEL